MVVAEVVGALLGSPLGSVCHHRQRIHLWVHQGRAALG
jgi:hypothetical protein